MDTVGASVDLLICSLPGPTEVVEALLTSPTSPLLSLLPGATVVDMTTNSVSVGGDLARRCQELGLAFVDAPVSGMPPEMTVMVGGDSSDPRVVQLLARLAKHPVYLGAPLRGYTAKLLHQYVFLSAVMANAEALAAARMLGVGADRLMTIAATGSAFSNALTVFPGIETTGRARAHSAPLWLLLKDLLLVQELDEASGLGLSHLDALLGAFRSAVAELGGDAPLCDLVDVVVRRGETRGAPEPSAG
jgi:3-hydroxyisobutyrate dehydrogenase-like beta-hydroxyacid dehydrogenase